MLKSHEKFHSANGKRRVLIADDEFINRAILGGILQDEYELLFAADGQEALKLIQESPDTLSLVLLDLLMPNMNGLELLRIVKADPALQQVPIVVLTSDQAAEVESLTLGAIDFIPKPYPQAEVIRARVLRTIELFEDRQIIQSTERDPLTGLYNREYFYRYAEQFDQYHRDMDMDAIVLDVNHFHMINERFGTAYGDSILRRIGQAVRSMVQESGGIVCRREADTFMVYCPHRDDYKSILDSAAVGLAENAPVSNRVRLRMGVYAHADKTLDIQRRFDRAKLAADTVRNNFTKNIGLYDNSLHEQELYVEQLIEGFHTALAERQFKVFYQPKFDIRPETPVLAGAEALVRWQHPTLGMISPGIFIPLFEENGLIQALDSYVWREAGAQIRDWKDRFGFSVPVSVNVSRIDMYDPDLIHTFQSILRDNSLAPEDIHLEITESAYTKDSEQIIATVNELRTMGFRIEMDDFGTGYSSLNMISTLPIDALKLDMQFIRNAFSQRKDTRMLEVIIDIADYLSVPVIAEGVETEEQLSALKAMGCDVVQGYYFSRPAPPDEFERFLIERKAQNIPIPNTAEHRILHAAGQRDRGFGRIAYLLSSGFERVYYVDIDNNHYVEFGSKGKHEDLQIQKSGSDFFADAQENIPRVLCPEDRDRVALSMRKEILLAQLTGAQPFTMTYRMMIDGEPNYVSMKATRVDGHHIVIGINNINAEMRRRQDTVTYSSIAQALAVDYFCIYYVDTETDRFIEFNSHEEYQDLNIEKGGEDFFNLSRRNIRRIGCPEDVDIFMEAFTKENILQAMETRGVFTLTYRLMFDGIPTYVHMKITRMQDKNDKHIVIGVSNIDSQIRREQAQAAALRSANEKASRDALTGVKSKHAFDEAQTSINERLSRGEHPLFAMVVCDVNGLKVVNDTLGHTAGDRLIKDASAIICNTFKHSPVFRIGGDEFVAILQGSDYDIREELMASMTAKNRENEASGGVIIASGLSEFRPEEDTGVSAVFERADAAMYENKKQLKSRVR